MANKIILPLMLVLVIGFAVTSVLAFTEAASLYADASDAISNAARAIPAGEAPVETQLVASR